VGEIITAVPTISRFFGIALAMLADGSCDWSSPGPSFTRRSFTRTGDGLSRGETLREIAPLR
jgi:hypothetical protein